MKWKLDGDGRSFQVWFTAAERTKMRRDAVQDATPFEDYLLDTLAHSMLGAAANVINCGTGSIKSPDAPPITFERIR
jgi:hypothetical protein